MRSPSPTPGACVALALALASCSRAPHTAPPPSDAGAPSPLEAAACAGRAGCYLTERLTLAPGSDGRGRVAVVVAVAGKPSETWLLARGPSGVDRVQLLTVESSQLEALPSGELRTKRVVPAQTWPAAFARQPSPEPDAFDFALEPPRLVRETGVGLSATRWDWDAFAGDAGGALVLPVVHVPDPAFATEHWRTTELRACGTPIESTASGTSVRLMVSGHTLYVEVHDDAFVTRGAVEDTLALHGSFIMANLPEDAWVERLEMDGTSIDRAGQRRPVPMVEVSPSTRRFAWPGVLPPRPEEVVTVDYDDTDDGKSVKERVALPDHDGFSTTLAVVDLNPHAQCKVKDGALQREPLVGGAVDVAILR